MDTEHTYALYSSVYLSFINESFPRCGRSCPFSRYCHMPFYLLESGEIKFFERPPPMDYWCAWPRCPRKWVGRVYRYGSELVSITELLRWHMEIGTHRSPSLSNGLAQLFRLYSVMRDKPRLLREHIQAKKMKAENDRRRSQHP